MRSGHLIALGLLLCAAAPATAQTYDTSYVLVPPSRCVVPDSLLTRVPVYAWIDLPDSGTSAFRISAENLLQDVAMHVRSLLGVAPNVLPKGEPSVRWFDSGTPLEVTARRAGRLTWRPAAPHDTAGAALLGRALANSLADGSFFIWDSTMVGDSVRFRVELTRPLVEMGGRVEPLELKHAAIPVFSMRVPREAEVAPKPGDNPPRYPDDARGSGYEATVVMGFVVDTTGHALMQTAHDIWPPGKPRPEGGAGRMYAEFYRAVLRALAKMQFYPANIGGVCRVDQWVQMPFEFKLSR